MTFIVESSKLDIRAECCKGSLTNSYTVDTQSLFGTITYLKYGISNLMLKEFNDANMQMLRLDGFLQVS